MAKVYAYVEHWSDAYRNNTALLLFGNVGTGKSKQFTMHMNGFSTFGKHW